MSFNSSADNLYQLDPSTDQLTSLMGNADDAEEILSIEEIRSLLKIPEKNTLSSYEDLHTIGVGGFGTVYAAGEPGLERKLALKILRPRYRQNKDRVYAFIREARITAKIAHPNVVPVHRIGVFDDAGLYFSMKRVAGETLRSILKKLKENRSGYRKKYPLPRLLDIFIGACQGVSYAHQNGILHCDLKPENLMVGNFGEVLVMDWGMARYLPEACDPDDCLCTLEKEKKHMGGTPVFMAPEHLSLLSNKPTVLSDIYALGCVLYSILTRQSSPFECAETLEEIQKKVVQEKIPHPRRIAPGDQQVPRELEAICLKAMARKPENRYASVNELLEDLRNFRDGLPVNAYSPSRIYKLGKFIFRRPLVPAVFFLSLLVWCGFSIYTVFKEQIFVQSLKLNAVNSFRNGEKRLLQARKRVSQLKGGTLNMIQMQALEQAIATDAADAEADFKTTLDNLDRIPLNYRDPQRAWLVSRNIFRLLSEYYTLTANDAKLHETALLFNQRWEQIFNELRKKDPELDRLFSHALSGTGSFMLRNIRDKKWHIEKVNGTKVSSFKIKPMTHSDGSDCMTIQLPAGLYMIVSQNPSGQIFKIPVRASMTMLNQVNLQLPRHIPEGMIFIPGGEFRHIPDLSNNFRRRSYEADFLIKKTEVSVAEYLEFWNSLKDKKLKELYASYYFKQPNSMSSYRSWDDNGKLLRPGLLPNHPVTGITGEAAAAFCAYMSRKLKRHVSLPSRSQWSKAAGGIDGTEYSWGNVFVPHKANINNSKIAPAGSYPGDSSLYGVLDLSGNVREFVKLQSKKSNLQGRYAIVGGSYRSLPPIARNSNITYSSRGGNDVGFRYVMSAGEKE